MIKNPTIKDFPITKVYDMDVIDWPDIEKVLGKVKYKKFLKFMEGQTCIFGGVFVCDVENFLRPKNKRFFD